MLEITDKCTFRFHLKGKRGQQTINGDILYGAKQIGSINWCGGVSHKRGFEVKMERPRIKIFKEG